MHLTSILFLYACNKGAQQTDTQHIAHRKVEQYAAEVNEAQLVIFYLVHHGLVHLASKMYAGVRKMVCLNITYNKVLRALTCS